MSVVETILVFAVIPLGIYVVVTLLTMRERFTKAPRYRPGQPWSHPPVWWTANPAGLDPDHTVRETRARTGKTAKGGARGSW